MCGASTCDGFCALAPTICPTQWQVNTCANRCGMLTSTPPYNIASSGDTLECRLYHLTAASVDPTTHCPHTDRMNSDTCQQREAVGPTNWGDAFGRESASCNTMHDLPPRTRSTVCWLANVSRVFPRL